MQRGHVRHDYPRPWVSYLDMITYNMPLDDVTGADFENSHYAFSQPRVQRIKPWPNDRSMSTTLLGAKCCVRLATLLRHVAAWCVLLAPIWPFLIQSQQHPTCRNIFQYGGQTYATCCAPQFREMLHWHVAIVWPGINNMYYYYSSKIFPRFWLVKTTRIIHITSCCWPILHIQPMTSKCPLQIIEPLAEKLGNQVV